MVLDIIYSQKDGIKYKKRGENTVYYTAVQYSILGMEEKNE